MVEVFDGTHWKLMNPFTPTSNPNIFLLYGSATFIPGNDNLVYIGQFPIHKNAT